MLLATCLLPCYYKPSDPFMLLQIPYTNTVSVRTNGASRGTEWKLNTSPRLLFTTQHFFLQGIEKGRAVRVAQRHGCLQAFKENLVAVQGLNLGQGDDK